MSTIKGNDNCHVFIIIIIITTTTIIILIIISPHCEIQDSTVQVVSLIYILVYVAVCVAR